MKNLPVPDVAGLFPELRLFQDPTLARAVIRAWEQAISKGNFDHPEKCHFLPREMGLPTRVSLVTHTKIVTELSLTMADILARNLPVQREMVLAGALLHDVGKLLEYAPAGEETIISKPGRRLNHRFTGASLCAEAGLPQEVVHIVYAHSEEGEIVTRSVEAVLVHHADFSHFQALRAALLGKSDED